MKLYFRWCGIALAFGLSSAGAATLNLQLDPDRGLVPGGKEQEVVVKDRCVFGHGAKAGSVCTPSKRCKAGTLRLLPLKLTPIGVRPYQLNVRRRIARMVENPASITVRRSASSRDTLQPLCDQSNRHGWCRHQRMYHRAPPEPSGWLAPPLT